MRKVFRALVKAGLARGWSRGVLDGNRAWIVTGGVAVLAHLAGRAMHREPEVVFSEKLAPGDAIRIFHEPQG